MGFRSPDMGWADPSSPELSLLSSNATFFFDCSTWLGVSPDEVGVISACELTALVKRRLNIFGGFDSAPESRGGVGGLAVGSVLDIDADCTIMAARTIASASIHRGCGESSLRHFQIRSLVKRRWGR